MRAPNLRRQYQTSCVASTRCKRAAQDSKIRLTRVPPLAIALVAFAAFVTSCTAQFQWRTDPTTGATTTTKVPLATSAAKGDYMKPGVSPVEILEARGYVAKEFFITTKDGYILSIVRGTNPLFNEGKFGLEGTLPLLLIPGTDLASVLYVTNANGVRPRNFRKRVDLSSVEDGAQLVEALDRDPSVRSLAFLAMNFGYEVWFLERRGSGRSNEKVRSQNRTLADALMSIPGQLLKNAFSLTAGLEWKRPQAGKTDATLLKGKQQEEDNDDDDDDDKYGVRSFWRDFIRIALSPDNLPRVLTNLAEFGKDFIRTFDPDYWTYSLDEPAKYDVPQTIEFVLKKSGKPRLHVTGISSGGTLILLAAAEQPKLAKKIASSILWAPALNMGSDSDMVYYLSMLSPIFSTYVGPLPFSFVCRQLVGILQGICSTKLAQRTLCLRLTDPVFGYSGDQSQFTQANLASLMQPIAVNELHQLGQFAHTPVPCKMNFSTPEKNMQVYGQRDAPCYDLSRVKLEHISFYQGNTDALVSFVDVEKTVSQLKVPSTVHFLNEPGLYFNHLGFIIHDENGRLNVGPSLLDMFRAERSAASNLTKSSRWTKSKSKQKSSGSSGSTSSSLSRFSLSPSDAADERDWPKAPKSGGAKSKSWRKTKAGQKLKSKSHVSHAGNLVRDYFV